jgi:hypothetical protein
VSFQPRVHSSVTPRSSSVITTVSPRPRELSSNSSAGSSPAADSGV